MNLTFSQIEIAAKKKNIVPTNLVLVDNDNKVIETIDFIKDTNFSKEWFVQWPTHSYIVYLHQFTSESKEQNIRIDHFLDRGFPIKKANLPGEINQKLTLKELQNCEGFAHINLIAFQSDKDSKPQNFEADTLQSLST